MVRKVSRTTKLCVLLAAMITLPGMADRLSHFDQRVVAAHNRERLALGVPALEWDPHLAAGAQEWADYLAASGKFEHSPDSPNRPREGENLWGGTKGAFVPESMVHLWVTEKVDFVGGVFPRNSRSGRVMDVSHYTQLIWRETTHVGCAIGEGAQEEILVCRYRRPGNIIGQRPL
jgi:Cysteine-rich secretory protein family